MPCDIVEIVRQRNLLRPQKNQVLHEKIFQRRKLAHVY